MLADLAVTQPAAFAKLAEQAKAAHRDRVSAKRRSTVDDAAAASRTVRALTCCQTSRQFVDVLRSVAS